jgi:serine phosphatase RsbU (regulator of sigma subunit)
MTKSIDKILKDIQIPFEEDDIAILYTDGITEARSNGKLDSPLF